MSSRALKFVNITDASSDVIKGLRNLYEDAEMEVQDETETI